ncbi:MAG TPA: lysylphosphatidylglycerol synthase transmembrane domain-containing protein [Candidatus Saccharimonadia bacterium]|jgi:uncharacterized protein (TIRG00374 family)
MKLRRLLILLGIIGIVIVIATTLGHPTKVLHAFRSVRWYVVPMVLAIQLVSYYCNARYYEAFLRISDLKVPLRRLYETALGINFANQALPSGGVSGATYLAEALRDYHVPAGKAALAQLGRYGFTFLSFWAVLSAGFVMLFFTDDLNKVSVRLIVFLMFLILGTGLTLLLVFAERKRLEAILNPIVQSINTFGRRVLRRHHALIRDFQLGDFLDDFYRGYAELLHQKRHWGPLVGWTLAGNLAEIATVYSVFLGFGHPVNPGIVITGYALAIIVSITSIFTNGIGVYEAGMIGTFSALGVPFALSFAVTLVYRILDMGMFLPIGFFFYRRHLKERTA